MGKPINIQVCGGEGDEKERKKKSRLSQLPTPTMSLYIIDREILLVDQ